MIRAYAWDLIKDEIKAVKDRVFLSRPNPVLLEELPCINIYFSDETAEISEGDRYIVQQYERKLTLAFDCIFEQPNDPEGLMRVEDDLDECGNQIERALFDDIFFEKRIPGYNPNARTNPGMLAGLRLLSVTPNELEISDRVLAFQTLVFELTYVMDAFIEHRYKTFEEYYMSINRVGWTPTTVDPVLIAAEGEFI